MVSTHLSKAKDLWAYLAMLLAGAERGDWWRAYVSRITRQHLPALERADFGKLDQALFTRTMMSPSAPRDAQRGGPASGVEGRPASPQKRRKVAACYAWNDGKPCVSSPCGSPTSTRNVGGTIRGPFVHPLGSSTWVLPVGCDCELDSCCALISIR